MQRAVLDFGVYLQIGCLPLLPIRRDFWGGIYESQCCQLSDI